MKISKLSLQNWRNMEMFNLEPGCINVLIGPNGSGKTSVLESIKTVLNGKTPSDFIRAGSTTASISADIDRVGNIKRVWTTGKPSKVSINYRTTTQKSIVESIEALYGISPETTTIMSSSDVIENLFGKDFARYILSFLKNDMDIEKLIALCAPTPQAEKIMRDILPPAPAVISLEEIEAAHENLLLQRTATKKARDVAAAKADYRGIIPSRTPKEINDKLMQCHEALGKLNAAERAYAEAQRALKQKEESMRTTAVKIAAITVTPPSAAEVKGNENAIANTRNAIAEQEGHIRVWGETCTRLSKILEKLETSVCPISEKLVCTTDKSGLRTELEEGVASAKEQGSLAAERKRAAQLRLAELEKKKAEINQRTSDYRVKLALQEQLEKMKAIKVAAAAKPDAEKKAQIDAFIKKLNEERAIVEAYTTAMKAQEEADRLNELADAYEELVRLFSPNGGARQKVLEHNLGPLQAYCNERMKKLLPKYSMLLNASHGFDVMFANEHGDCIAFDALSNGEKIRVIYILTSMLNELNQFRILMLDNLDGLDRENLQALVDIVMEDKDAYDHIFFASVDNTEAKDVLEAIPGACVIHMGTMIS